MMKLVWVALGGAVGAGMRYGVMQAVAAWGWAGFPYATLLINATGSFLMGWLAFALLDWQMLSSWLNPMLLRPFLLIGVLGAYTTFSTYAFEVLQLFQAQRYASAMVCMLANVLFSLIGVVLGAWLAQHGKVVH